MERYKTKIAKKINGKTTLWKDRKCKLWKEINGKTVLWKDIKCK